MINIELNTMFLYKGTLKKNSEFNKIFSPILSNKFLIRITKFLLFLQYFIKTNI